MLEAVRPDSLADESADAVVASAGKKLLGFLSSPFSIVLAMRPQREREAARIAREFHCRRWPSELKERSTEKFGAPLSGIVFIERSGPMSTTFITGAFPRFRRRRFPVISSILSGFRIRLRRKSRREAQAEAIANRFGCDRWSDAIENEISRQLR
jgi:hypothetical protein